MLSISFRIFVVSLCCLCVAFFRPVALHADTTAQEAATAPGSLTFEAAFGDGVQEYTADLLLPFWRWAEGLIFFNPQVTLTEDDGSAERFSLGFGLRHLAGEHLLLGANLYYDRGTTEADRDYDQFGLGLELLSEWVDGRFNYYVPEDDRTLIGSFATVQQQRSSRSWWDDPYAKGHGIWQKRRTRTVTTTITRQFEFFEEAMEGWDAEVGVKLPFLPAWAETRVFCGGYRFEAPYGDDLQGWKGRIEVRPMRGLIIDAAVYEDAELYGADWAVGARLSIPFDLSGLLAGTNPFHQAADWFRPGRRPFAERLGDMVIRDGRVHTEAWGPIENLAAKQTRVDTQETATKYTLLPDVMFVDGGRAGERQDGTWEHPFDLVQEGVDGVFGERNVYVNAFDDIYRENVVLTDGVQLWGSGWLIEGHDGKTFGSGIQPVIDGGGTGPVIRLASDNSVRGFHLVNTSLGTPIIGLTTMFGPRSIQNTGILGIGIGGTTVIEGNTIDTLGDGIMLVPASGSIALRGNDITSVYQSGIYIQAENAVLDVVSIMNNTSNGGPGWDGITLTSEGSTLQNLHISNNNLSGSWGLYIEAETSSIVSASIIGNTIDAELMGILLANDISSSISSLTISGNTIHAGQQSIYLVNDNSSSISPLVISNNTIQAGLQGIYLVNDNSSSISPLVISNNTIQAGLQGIYLANDNSSSISSLVIANNTIQAGLQGIVTYNEASSSISSLSITDNMIDAGVQGISLFNFYLSSIPSLLILDNTIDAGSFGIFIVNDYSSLPFTTISGNSIFSSNSGINYTSFMSPPTQITISANSVASPLGVVLEADESAIAADISSNDLMAAVSGISLLTITPSSTINAFTTGEWNTISFGTSAINEAGLGIIINTILWGAP